MRTFLTGIKIVTVKRAGSDHIYNLGVSATQMFLDPGTSAMLINDGTYWLVRQPTPLPQTYFVDEYGADPTGVSSSNTAVAGAVAAMGSNPGILEFGPGKYLLSATTTVGAFQGIRGQGRGVTTINFTGTGDCFRAWDQTAGGVGGQPPNPAGPIEGFTIEGSGAGANSSGLHIGDLFGAQVRDVLIADFAASGSIGLWLDNRLYWFERGDIDAVINNCTNCVVFDVNGGDTSFDYVNYNLSIWAYANQNGVLIRNGATLYHTKLTISGNCLNCNLTPSGGGVRGGWTNSSTNTGVVLAVGTSSADTANIVGSELSVLVENGGLTGSPTTPGHYTVQVGQAATLQANGILDFLSLDGFAWQDGTLSGQFTYAGRCNVDNVLGTTGYGQSHTFTGALTTPGGFIDTAGSASTAYLSTGNIFFWRLASGSNTLTLSVPTGQMGFGVYEFLVQQPAAGSAGTLTWPVNLFWLGDAGAPTLSSTNDAINLIRVYTWDQSNFFGYLAQ